MAVLAAAVGACAVACLPGAIAVVGGAGVHEFTAGGAGAAGGGVIAAACLAGLG